MATKKSAPKTKKPDPKVLGKGMARKAAEALIAREKKRREL